MANQSGATHDRPPRRSYTTDREAGRRHRVSGVNGYETFSANEDWWPDDATTEALRDVPQPPLIVQDDNYYMDLLERMGLVRRLDAVEAEASVGSV